MPYMLVVLEESAEKDKWPDDVGRERYVRMMGFYDDLKARGVVRTAESLASDRRGLRIKTRAGRTSVVDGPFAEAKEVVGGFFLLDCATWEEAIAIAKECPAAEWSTVEVRVVAPCWEDAVA